MRLWNASQVLAGFAVLAPIGCSTAQTGATDIDPLREGDKADRDDEPSKLFVQPVDLRLGELVGTWFGQVKNIYRACVTFGPVEPTKPWALQRIDYRIEEGLVDHGPVDRGQIVISRNGVSFVEREPVYFLQVPRTDRGDDGVFWPGTYNLGRLTSLESLMFWQYWSSEETDTRYTSTEGFQIATEGIDGEPTLHMVRLGGDLYCTNLRDGTTTLCGAGGGRPYLMTQQSCPDF
jgi:hypothetical protein